MEQDYTRCVIGIQPVEFPSVLRSRFTMSSPYVCVGARIPVLTPFPKDRSYDGTTRRKPRGRNNLRNGCPEKSRHHQSKCHQIVESPGDGIEILPPSELGIRRPSRSHGLGHPAAVKMPARGNRILPKLAVPRDFGLRQQKVVRRRTRFRASSDPPTGYGRNVREQSPF